MKNHHTIRTLATRLRGLFPSAKNRRSARSGGIEALEQRIAPATFLVDTVANSGTGSLRQAILDANGAAGTDTIVFNIPGAGPHVIQPTSSLPAISTTMLIDGYTEPGSSANTLAVGDNAVLNIVIDGSLASSANGLVLSGGGSTVRGLAIHGFLDPSGTADSGYGIIVIGGNNTIAGNFIGTDQTGTTDLGNRRDGIQLRGQNTGNTIGGTAPDARNVILGNGEDGIEMAQTVNSANSVLGNYIGTDRTGTLDRGNTGAGLQTRSFESATIRGNLISGNDAGGIVLGGGSSIITSNRIGLAPSGIAPGIPNTGAGIAVNGGGGHTIGDSTPTGRNTIAYNSGDGVFIAGTTTSPSAIRFNDIFQNGGLGIDLGGGVENAAGVTQNDTGDADTGANDLQNYPVISSATRTSGGTVINGTLNSTPSTSFTLEFFFASTDPSGFGEGNSLLIGQVVTTDSAGNAPFNVTSPLALTGGTPLTATATRTTGSSATSEFSQVILVTDPFQVTTTLDTVNANDSVVSLREAILAANGTAGLDTITFNIPGAAATVRTINVGSTGLGALPAITDTVVIDGYSQPGARANTLAVGSDATLLIELNGNGGNFNGLTITGGGTTVKGLVINKFGNAGVSISGSGGNTISGDFIGTDATGSTALGNTNYGMFIGSSGNQIGGTSPGDRNVISGTTSTVVNVGIGVLVQGGSNNVFENNYVGTNAAGTVALGSVNGGVRIVDGPNNKIGGTAAGAGNLLSGNTGNYNLQIVGASASGNLIQGNFVGTNASGTAPLAGASADGIQLIASNNTVGGTAAGARNIISGNSAAGLRTFDFNGALGSGNSVLGNYIGLDVTGTVAVPNTLAGIELLSTGPNTIGGTAAGEGNTIAFNGGDGVRVTSGSGHAIRGNSIFSNTGLGLDLGGNGATANDIGDGDTGPNNLQNFPIITSVAGNTTAGTINSTPGTTLTLHFYSNPVNENEGRVFLGSTNVTTDGTGNAPYTFTPGTAIAAGSFVTATATDGGGNTSEFSAARAVASVFTWDGSASTDWFTAANWTPAGVPGAADIAILDINSAIQLTGNTSVAAFQQSNGVFGSTAGVTFTVLESFAWTGGAQNNSAGNTVIPVGGTLTLGVGGKTLNRTLINNGTTDWTGGGVGTTIAGGAFTNNGTFNASATANFGGVIFTNAPGAVLNQLSGTNTFFNGTFVNNGTANVAGGTLVIGSGTGGTGTSAGSFAVANGATLNFGGGAYVLGGASVSGAGNVTFNGGTTTFDATTRYTLTGTTSVTNGAAIFNIAAPVIFPNLLLSQTAITVGGALGGSSAMSVTGAFTWTGGRLDGAAGAITRVEPGATLTLNGAFAQQLFGRTLEVAGTANFLATTALEVTNGATINNRGLWHFQSTGDIREIGTPSAVTFNNLAGGTVRKSGTGRSDIDIPFTNAGTVELLNDTLLFTDTFTQTAGSTALNGGALSTFGELVFAGGTLVSGAGTSTISGDVRNTGATIRPGGTGVAGTLTVTGNYMQGAGGTLAAELGGVGAGAFDVLNVSGTTTLGGALNIAHLGAFTPANGNTFRVVQSAGNPGTFATLTGASAGKTQTADATGLVLAQAAVVTTFIWDAGAGADTSFFNPLNWDRDAGFPGAADTAILQTNATITLGTNTSVSALQQSAGTFTGDATLTAATFVWSGGTQGGFGTTQVSSTLNLANSGGMTLGSGGNTARTLISNGVATLSGGNLLISTSGGGFSGSSFINNGTFNVADGADILMNNLGGGPAAFSNAAGATFNKSGAGTVTTIGPGLTNAGTINLNSGTLESSGGATVSGGTLAVSAGTTLRSSGGNFFVQAAATLSGAGTFEVTGGNVNLQSYALTGAVVLQGGSLNFTALSRTLPTLTQSGGTLFGSGMITVSGALVWSGGTQNGGGTTIANGALDLTNVGGLNLGLGGSSQRTLISNGVATLSGGNLILVSIGGATPGSQFVNNGTFNVTDGADISIFNFGGPAPLFTNASGGIFNKSGAGTVTTFSVPLSNAGTINVNSGTLESEGGATITGTLAVGAGATLRTAFGTLSVAAGATLSGAGTIEVVSGTVNLQSFALTGAVVQQGGTVNFNALNPTLSALTQSNGLLTGSGTITVTGAMVWSNGTQGGAGTTIANGTLALPLSGFPTLGDGGNTGRTLINNGVATLSGANLSLSTSGGAAPGAQIINNGTFNATDNADIVLSAIGGSAPLFTNAAGGTFNKSGAGTLTTINAPLNNAGTINVNASGLELAGTFAQTGGATVLAGSGVLVTPGTLTFQGGELRGAGSVNGSLNNTGATVRPGGTGAAGTIAISGGYTQGAGGALAVELGGTGAGTFDVLSVSGAATLGGTIDFAHINAFTPANGNTFRVVQSAGNPGTFATLTGATSGKTQAADATGLVITQGPGGPLTFIWDGGAGADQSWFNPINWNLDSGVPGATDTAILQTAQTISLPSNTSVSTFQQSNGTFTSPAGVTFTVLTNFAWTNGTQSGAGSTISDGTLTLRGAGTKTLTTRSLINNGTANLSGAGGMFLTNALITNNGVFNVTDDADVASGGGSGGFANSATGTLNKSGAGTTSTFYVTTNAGTVNVASGTLNFSNGFTQTAGSTVLSGGSITGTFGFNYQGGELRGSGSIGNGIIINTGAIVRPGGTGAAGTLTITGPYTQETGGRVAVEVGGTGAGQFDVLAVTGSASLNGGAMDVSFLGGFTPGSADTFRVLTVGGRNGNFQFVNGPLVAQYNPTNVTLISTPGIFNWDAGGLADTNWFNPANWSPDGVPGATDSATLRINATATLPSSTSVGTWIHDGTSAAILTIPAGAALTVLNNFTWTGGTENGAGTLTVVPGASFNYPNGQPTFLTQRTLNLQGAGIFNSTSGNALTLASGATINNSGMLDFQVQISIAGTGTFNNLAAGTLRKTTTNTTVIFGNNVAFTNAGTVRAELGTLGVNGGYTQTAGSSQMVGGILNIFPSMQIQGGELAGVGAFSGMINNTGGVVRPGGAGAIGTLTTNGNYFQAAGGTIELEIAGTGAGQFDVFAPGGNAFLNGGALTAPLLGGFSPASGDPFRVLTALGVIGTFASTPPGLAAQYSDNTVTLIAEGGGASPIIVTTTLDVVNANDGVVSLREAITFANATAGTDTISFNIPGGGVKTITVSTALPALTEAAVIDGYTQPGSSANTLATGNNAVLNIVLAGASNTLGNGLTISASGVTVRGLVVQNFTNGIAVIGGNAVIAGNWIGVAQSGAAAAGNADDGIRVSASNATVGGTTPAARNVISGNGGSGIEMTGGIAGLNVQGNYIGTNAAGTAAVGNAGDGITLLAGAFNSTIGGLTAAARNVISGNVSRGVIIFGDTNVVAGNYIGTDATGMFAVKNSFDGLTIAAPGSNNFIGGSAAGAGNVISGNDIAGVTIESINASPNPATGNRVQGNLIGVAADGVTPLGNTAGTQKGWGIAFFRNATDNIVGGVAAGEGNTIANNAGAGIAVLDAGPVGNRFFRNSIFANGDLGIDLGAFSDPANSVLANDGGDGDSGPNTLLNYPVLTSASGTLISGTYNGGANQTFTLEFFSNTAGDASGFGEGRTFLGTTNVSTDGTGNGSFTFSAATLSPGTPVSATASIFGAGTSEFSRFIVVTGNSSTVVTTALDVVNANDGVVSLREAITFANGNSGLDTITFAIPGTGVQTIALTSALPTITDPVKIDGYTQTGATVNTNALGLGTNAVLRIELNGANAGGGVNGLTITAGGSTVQGLVINRFGGDGILLSTVGGNSILGNFIGTNATGSATLGNLRDGVEITSGTANLIGDGTGAGRNVISGNGTVGNSDIHNGAGVLIFNSGTNANIVSGNFIGTNATGLIGLGNTKSGVGIYDGASANAVNANVISGNTGHGLDIAFSATNNTATANTIGAGVNRTTSLGNVGAGVLVNFSAINNTIGGSSAALGNFVSANGLGGIVVGNGSSGARIFANTVSGNTGHGIEITGSAGAVVGLASPPNIVIDNTGDGIRLTGAGTTGTLVQGNFVGVIPNGTVARPNGGAGIAILNGATASDIGGTSIGNTIAGNTGDGVLIDNADNNLVRGNRIGQTGISTGFFPNGGAGVSVNDSTGIRIGSPATSELNIIARNLGDGIEVTGSSTVTARGNIIEGNGGLGIDLGGNGVTANDLDDNDTGPNTLLNFPTLTTYTRTNNGSGLDHVVAGTYSGAPNTTFTIDLYANAAQDASRFGEGQFLIQSFSVTTDDDGDAAFTRTFTTGANNVFGAPLGSVLTSQATLGNGASGPSSEFSNALGGTPPVQSDALFFTAQALGSRVEIRKVGNGELMRTFSAFNPAFKGGVRIASGDVNGDGVNDVIAATGDGGGARVRVFDGHNTTAGRPTVLYDFFPYGNGYRGGLYVAAGDVNGDGLADIIVAPSAGASGTVKVFEGEAADSPILSPSVLTSFVAFGRGSGGVRVAAGDINGDGRADIIAGTGAGSIVRVFDGQNTANVLKEFRAFPATFRGGVTVAAGDVDGDGLADIIVGAGAGSNAVRTFLSATSDRMVEFNAFPGAGRGVNVAAVDFNGDGIADIIAAQARLAAPKIRIYDGTSVLTGGTSAPLIRNAFTFDPAYLGGVFVG